MKNGQKIPTEGEWVQWAEDRLLGQHVALVRYLENEESEQMGWTERPLCIQFSDGSIIFAQCDPEGNAAGTIIGFGSTENLPDDQYPEEWGFPPLGLK